MLTFETKTEAKGRKSASPLGSSQSLYRFLYWASRSSVCAPMGLARFLNVLGLVRSTSWNMKQKPMLSYQAPFLVWIQQLWREWPYLWVGLKQARVCLTHTAYIKWPRSTNVWKLCISQGDTWDSGCRKEGNREMLLVLNKDTEGHCRPKAPILKTGSF